MAILNFPKTIAASAHDGGGIASLSADQGGPAQIFAFGEAIPSQRYIEKPNFIAPASGSEAGGLKERKKHQFEEKVPDVPGLYKARYKHKTSWVFRFRYWDAGSGRRKRDAITIGDIETVSFLEAVAEVRRMRDDIKQGLLPFAGREFFRDFLEGTYLKWAKANKRSWRDDVHRGRKLLNALGHMAMKDIKRPDIQRALDQLRREGLSANSVANIAMLASAIFRVAIEFHVVSENPAKGVKAPRKARQAVRVLLPDEQIRLGRALVDAPLQLRYLIELILCLGLRIGEAIAIRFDHIDWTGQMLRIPGNKSGVEQAVPLPPRATTILRALQSLQHGGYAFGSARGDKPIAIPYRAFRALMNAAEIEGVTWHTLRKTVATEAMACKDVSALDVSRLLRHQSIRTTEVFYLGTSDQRLRIAATAASELLGRRLTQGQNLVLALRPTTRSIVISPSTLVIVAGTTCSFSGGG